MPDYRQIVMSPSVRHDTLSPVGDKRAAQFVLEVHSQDLERSYPTATGEQTGPRKNIYIDPNKREEGRLRYARKRWCGVGRANGYNAGCEIEDTATPIPESRHLNEPFGLLARVYG